MAETSRQLDPQARPDPQAVRDRVETILRRDLKLGPDVPIHDDMPLIGGDFELDSLDIVLMVTSIEKEFGIKIANETIGKDAFSSVATLVQFLQERIEQNQGTPQSDHAANNGKAKDNGHTTTAAPENSKANANGNGHPPPQTAEADHLLAALPHQPPFRFISRITELAPQVHGEAQWDLTGDEDFFAGHFPGRPILPGVLISEALAQISGLVGVDPRATQTGESHGAELAHVDVRFRHAAAPPATVVLRSRMLQDMDGLQRFEVQAIIQNTPNAADQTEQIIADGQITLKRTDAR